MAILGRAWSAFYFGLNFKMAPSGWGWDMPKGREVATPARRLVRWFRGKMTRLS
jgi:hypothetical protein